MKANRWAKRIAIAGVGVILTAVFVVKSGLGLRLYGPGVVDNALVGQTEEQVRRSYGTPEREETGYHPLALEYPKSLPTGPIKTLIFKPRGLFRLEGGCLWAWFAQHGDTWVCFESCWYADGVQF